ncbi:DUF6519 domain-containing protein [Kribbella kalugense]|uniref:Uncharacterized protein n=1 Tax=Kribbella kalugense TaxID=2512221 RepID=A0A4R7ZVH1_9ACTN|nr:DUF6519 domain-containing protein [Kribbella kalugense]TDW22089.1 hypothetical protein EV650_0921 [Kribbella kalugense]
MNGGDLTRSTFRSYRHYSGVRMQQGRVQLDADWNEQLDVAAYRDETRSADVIGASGVPKVDGGFGVDVVEDDLLLTTGRAWVGGLLCEIDGEVTRVTDQSSPTSVAVASLVLDGAELQAHDWIEALDAAGSVGSARVESVDVGSRTIALETAIGAATEVRRRTSYCTQPDLPEPEHTSLPVSTGPRVLDLADGNYLVYLDAWQRAVTSVDDPSLTESALGVDTTTRSQVVWQVRLLDLAGVPGEAELDAALAAAATATGRMAARAVPPPDSIDLCRPTPAGGYIGLENQLYRIQVYDVNAGKPVIVWSRENGSVVTRWLGNVRPDVLEVESIGRDAVLGFSPGDLVELYDDTRVLQGLPGTLVRLKNAQGNQLTLETPASIDDFGSNPQVRRWDGSVTVDSDDWFLLEKGVEVRFPAGGTFDRHDYWLVPARSSQAGIEWPEDSSGRPLAQLPSGVAHHLTKIAVLRRDAGVITVVDDRRDRFPALTALAAEDIALSNTVCDLPATATVQDALDILCRANDLRRHNRLLHGYGIVSGLAVHCGDETAPANQRVHAAVPTAERQTAFRDAADADLRRHVTVQPGSAIDADGNDLDLAAPTVVDVLSEIGGLGDVLNPDGDGEVCVVLRGESVVVTKYEPEPPRDFLQGTLLKDIYDDCIASPFNWIKRQLTPGDGTDPIADQKAYRLRTALTNLATYVANPKSGGNVFVAETEDALLRDFYTGLRKRLQSETFCALFDDARPYPDYPATLTGIRTVSGVGSHARARSRPGGTEIWTVGAGLNPLTPSTLVNRYDLDSETLIARIDPIAGRELPPGESGSSTTAAVTDVTFSPDGKLVAVAVPTRDDNDTIFRVGEISGTTVNWRPAATICGVRLVTMATTAVDPGFVYAVGLRRRTTTKSGFNLKEFEGAGVWRIPFDNVPDNLAAIQGTEQLNPVGPLAIGLDGAAVVSCGTPGSPATSYNRLRVINISANGPTLGIEIGLQTDGTDDLTVQTVRSLLPFNLQLRTLVYTVSGRGTSRALVGFNCADGSPLHTAVSLEALSGTISLAMVGGRVVLAGSDDTTAIVYDPSTGALVDGLRIPVQVTPTSMTIEPTPLKLGPFILPPRRLTVLNLVSNSLTVIDTSIIGGTTFDLGPLTAYRRKAVEAFGDLVGGFTQYVKDCAFDHFLVRPPKAPPTKDLDLAAVSIRGGSVYRVCNFARRRYVKSFPTVGYWMSLVPLLPFLREQLVKFACTVLTDRFAAYSTEDHDNSTDRVPASTLLGFLETVQGEDPLALFRQGKDSVTRSARLARSGEWTEARNTLRRSTPAEPAPSEDITQLRTRLEALETQLANLQGETK